MRKHVIEFGLWVSCSCALAGCSASVATTAHGLRVSERRTVAAMELDQTIASTICAETLEVEGRERVVDRVGVPGRCGSTESSRVEQVVAEVLTDVEMALWSPPLSRCGLEPATQGESVEGRTSELRAACLSDSLFRAILLPRVHEKLKSEGVACSDCRAERLSVMSTEWAAVWPYVRALVWPVEVADAEIASTRSEAVEVYFCSSTNGFTALKLSDPRLQLAAFLAVARDDSTLEQLDGLVASVLDESRSLPRQERFLAVANEITRSLEADVDLQLRICRALEVDDIANVRPTDCDSISSLASVGVASGR